MLRNDQLRGTAVMDLSLPKQLSVWYLGQLRFTSQINVSTRQSHPKVLQSPGREFRTQPCSMVQFEKNSETPAVEKSEKH
jgi:hypothetical protein